MSSVPHVLMSRSGDPGDVGQTLHMEVKTGCLCLCGPSQLTPHTCFHPGGWSASWPVELRVDSAIPAACLRVPREAVITSTAAALMVVRHHGNGAPSNGWWSNHSPVLLWLIVVATSLGSACNGPCKTTHINHLAISSCQPVVPLYRLHLSCIRCRPPHLLISDGAGPD